MFFPTPLGWLGPLGEGGQESGMEVLDASCSPEWGALAQAEGRRRDGEQWGRDAEEA